MYKKKGKNPYLERRSLNHGGESPSFPVPCLKSTAPYAPCLPKSLRTVRRDTKRIKFAGYTRMGLQLAHVSRHFLYISFDAIG
jgi:hypothetical protein